jgi:hypothetical protein
LPLSNLHLQTLCHSTFASTLISFDSCTAVDSRVGEIPMTYNVLSIEGNLTSESVLRATLTEPLTKLILSHSIKNTFIEQILKTGVRFDTLRTLSLDEQQLALFMQHRQTFPNVLHLSVSSHQAYPTKGTEIYFNRIISHTAFEKLEILKCPLNLLSQFLGRQIRELTLLHDPPWGADADPHQLDNIRYVINRSEQLLSRLEILRPMNLMNMGQLLEEFLAQCHELKSCTLCITGPRLSFNSRPLIELTVVY